MNYLKIIFSNLIILLLLSSCLEITARLVFPEFKDHIFSKSKSMNLTYHDGNFHGYQIRKPSLEPYKSKSLPMIIIVGDSISGGYGTAYEDIWWEKLRRILKISDKNYEIISISAYGNNIGDAVEAVNKISKSTQIGIERIIYQFNFNDIMPFQKNDLKNLNKPESLDDSFLNSIAKWRYEYFNYSVFLRTMQHYGGQLIRQTSGTCEERDMHALGPYTWSYGSMSREDESEIYWDSFKKNIMSMKISSEAIDADFEIFISPILYDIDARGIHQHYNYLNYDFSCATIDPRKEIISIAQSFNTKIYDPAIEMKRSFEARIKEGNFSPYFFAGDDNHFTPLASSYVAEHIASEWDQ
tara:strand:- start:3011 stop:4075 length:1065 start_codon:yes stop_codon:yes gene_type:complete